jgi:two-component system nitrogen regulation sensor histidine kinase NtrY
MSPVGSPMNQNPLTPIQLSAERLRRKYLAEIKNDPQIFSTCIDTIIRQVDDIGGMIDEFSSFARMPAPVLKEWDLGEIARRTLFLQQNANPGISYVDGIPSANFAMCDSRQIGQALTNRCSTPPIHRTTTTDLALILHGRREIRLTVTRDGGRIAIVVEDNGLGLQGSASQAHGSYVDHRPTGWG